MHIQEISTGDLYVKTYCFKLNEETLAVIDPGGSDAELLDYIKSTRLKKLAILLTHGHFDHVAGIPELVKLYPETSIYIHELDKTYLGETGIAEHLHCFKQLGMERYIKNYAAKYPSLPTATHILSGGETIGDFKILHTPGHTPGSICFYNKAENILFSGDTLFYRSRGRTDLPGGNEMQLCQSLKMLFTSLPANTKVYSGHSYITTIGEEAIAQAYLI